MQLILFWWVKVAWYCKNHHGWDFVNQVLFKSMYEKECVKSTKGLVKSNATKWIFSIIEASKKYNNDLHTSLESKVSYDPNLTVYYYKNCVSRCSSKSSCEIKYASISDQEEPPNKLRKSDCYFNFREHCLYWGESCQLEKRSIKSQKMKSIFFMPIDILWTWDQAI